MNALVVDPVGAAYRVTSDQPKSKADEDLTVILKFENLLLLTTSVSSILTAHSLFASVTTLKA
jgi:hypothetical protein